MALDWLPILADPRRDQGLPPAIGSAFFAQSLPQAQVLARLWSESQPTYPAILRRKLWEVPSGMVWPIGVSAGGPTSVIPLSWAPQAPAAIVGLRTFPAGWLAQTPRPLVSETGWLPQAVYPSQFPPRRPAEYPASFSLTAPLVPPPVLSWAPTTPVTAPAAVTIASGNQLPVVFAPLPVPGPPPPGLGYQTTVAPLFILPRTSVPLPAQQTFGANLLPIPRPAPPAGLPWQGRYPDQVLDLRPRVWLQPSFVISPMPLAVLLGKEGGWHPVYPDPVRSPWPARLYLAQADAQNWLLPPIPTDQWLSVAPALLRPPVRVPDLSQTVAPFFIATVTVPTSACVILDQPLLGVSMLASEFSGISQLTAEGSTPEALTAEETCP